jgi:hypothetical protein
VNKYHPDVDIDSAKRRRPPEPTRENAPACLVCNKSFSTNSNVLKHLKKYHPGVDVRSARRKGVLESKRPKSWQCQLCEVACVQRTDIVAHYNKSHNMAGMVISNATFDCMQDFIAWKEFVEKSDKCRYVKQCHQKPQHDWSGQLLLLP